MVANWYFLASSLLLKYLLVPYGIWAVWRQRPHLSYLQLSPQSSPAHSWYAKYISWIKEIQLYQYHSEWHWILNLTKESVSLIARWVLTDRMLSQTCRGKKKKKKAGMRRKGWPENFAFWVLWICWESPDFWLKIFTLILVFFLTWYIYHFSLFGYTKGLTAMN